MTSFQQLNKQISGDTQNASRIDNDQVVNKLKVKISNRDNEITRLTYKIKRLEKINELREQIVTKIKNQVNNVDDVKQLIDAFGNDINKSKNSQQ